MKASTSITWVEAHVLFDIPLGDDMLGICGFSKRIFKHGGPLQAIVIRDVFIDEECGWCEEAHNCIDFDCKLNTTTRMSYAAAHRLDRNKLPSDFATKTHSLNLSAEGQLLDFSQVVDEKSRGAILLSKC